MCPIAKQVALGALLLLFSSGSAAQAQQGPAGPATKNAIDGWSGRFQPPGVDGTVYATAQIGDKVYVGGDFTEAGGVAARDLAVWDRSTKTWSATALELDASAVSDDSVAALAVGPRDSLYVGGHFEPKNSTSTNIVALKDGTVSGYSGGLTDGSAGRGSVQALLNHQGTLYATGEISDAAGAAPRGFVRRTGGQWEVPGALANEDGSTGIGYALEIDLQGHIAIGGRFDEILQKPGSTRNIAAWDPAADDWVAYGEGLRGGQGTTGAVYALTLHTHQERQTQYLYAGGNFSVSAQSSSLNNVAFLGGNGWESATGGTNGPVYALQGGGGVLRVGGDFTQVGNGSTNAHDIAVLSTSWQAWGGGTGRDSDVSSVRALLRDGSDTFVGGKFVLAGPPGKRSRRKANGLALWDGQWTALGRGIERGSTTGVDAIVEGPGGSIFAGGLFTYAGGKPVRNVARWDGSQWHSLGGGLDHLVSSLAIDGNTLYVGGTFTNARNGTTDVTVNYVARWDGSQWSSLGGGMDDRVFALVFDSGTLYAGGEFTSPGQKLAQWDGSAWSPVGGGTNGNVSALATHDGALYVGGVFSQAGGTSVSDIARWDGNSWSAVGGGVANPSGSYHRVDDLAVSPFGELFVGGQFTKAGNTAVSHVARWFKGRWFPLGSGTDSPVEEVDFAGECQLYAGGFFSNAGGSPAGNVAAWNGAHWTAFAEEFKGGGVTAVRTTTRGLLVGGDFRALVNQDGTQKASSGVALWGGGFPGGSPSAALSLFSPSEDTLYYAAPESLRVDLSGASGIDSVDIVFSMDGGSSWETAAQGVKVKNDTASTVWEVPNRTSASKVILRVRSSTNPCLFAEKTYEYFHSQNAGKRVTHIYRFPNETEFFDPDLHGYPFENDSAGVWPKPVRPDYSNRSGYFRTVTQADPSYFPSWEIFCDAAGDAFCYFPAPQLVGVKWPRQNAALIWRAIASGGFRGACAGFAVTSFLAFENNQTVLNDLGIPSNGFVHDVSASQGRRPVAKYFTRELTLATVQKALSNAPKTPTETLNEVRAMLAQPPGSGRELKDLAIWTLGKPRSEINFNDLEEVSNLEPMGHVVTPYRVERDPSNPDRWSIYVYDNNHAGADQARIIVNTATNSWTFPDVWAPDPGYSGTGKFAGLFLVEDVTNYLGTRPPKQKQSKARPASAGATGRLSSEWSRNRALLDTHVRMLNTQGTHLTIRDGSDRSIGYEQGILVNDMRGSAMPLLLRTGRPQPPIGFVVPENRTYEVEASNTRC